MRLNEFLVPVSDIICNVANRFDTELLHRAGMLINDIQGIINPLVVRRIGQDKYELIDGVFGYYAAVEAEKIDPMRCELINAYIVERDQEQNIANQLEILQKFSQPESTVSNSQPTTESVTSPDVINQILAIVTQQSKQLEQLTRQVASLSQIITSQHEELAKMRGNISNTAVAPPTRSEPKSVLATEPESVLPVAAESVVVVSESQAVLPRITEQQVPIAPKPEPEPEPEAAISELIQPIIPEAALPEERHPPIILESESPEGRRLHALNSMNKEELASFLTKLKIQKPIKDALWDVRKKGPFQSFQAMLKIKGVGQATVKKIQQAL